MDRLLTAEEIAQRLGVTTQWVWAQARAGQIPHVRLGRYRRFREPAIEAWIRQLETESLASPRAAARAPVRLRARA
jgi:excisionase family DNA binding protein